jgi:hypothetical protein
MELPVKIKEEPVGSDFLVTVKEEPPEYSELWSELKVEQEEIEGFGW